MATNISDVYDFVIAMFTDGDLAQLNTPDKDFLFQNWYMIATSTDVKEISDRKPGALIVDFDLGTIDCDLDVEEKAVIAKAMVLRWLSWVINDRGRLKNRFRDRDFSVFDPSALINALEKRKEILSWEIKETRERYDFDGDDWASMR